MLSYLGNTENYLAITDLNYIQADFFGESSYYYPRKDNLVLDHSLVLFDCRPINNSK
jgi:hypothetical protein